MIEIANTYDMKTFSDHTYPFLLNGAYHENMNESIGMLLQILPTNGKYVFWKLEGILNTLLKYHANKEL